MSKTPFSLVLIKLTLRRKKLLRLSEIDYLLTGTIKRKSNYSTNEDQRCVVTTSMKVIVVFDFSATIVPSWILTNN